MSRQQGSCHCGAVTFQAELDVSQAIACNCSMCGRTGTWLVFVPEGNFELLSGEASLRDYQFGKKNIHHLFCTTCGVKPFARGVDPEGKHIIAVNVRCLDGFDVREHSPTVYDGAAL